MSLLSANHLATMAQLFAQPARAAMILALMDGRALSAGELATVASLTPATISAHLKVLLEAGILTALKQGRHRYFTLASPDIADAVEGLCTLTLSLAPRLHTGPKQPDLCFARSCYDHLAGQLGVALADVLIKKGYLNLSATEACLSEKGRETFAQFSIIPSSTRPYCRACLDWSERRFHLGGQLGAMLLSVFFERAWLVKTASRALTLTPAGREGFRCDFGVTL